MYKIGELSRLSQVPIRTLRYYDQIGLLVPAQVDRSSGYRCYAAEQFERLNRILVFKDLGLTLDEIRALLSDHASAGQIRELVQQKHAELERCIETERRRLARAAARLALIDGGGGAIPDIAVRVTDSPWIASIRETIGSHDECDRLFDELDRRLGGRRARRQRGAIWHACEPGAIDCEAFEIIPARISETGRVSVRQLPAQRVAALIYRGEVDYLPAYRAMRAWIGMTGLAVAGPKRELFLRGPSSVTEIQFPVDRPARITRAAGGRAPAHQTRSSR